MTLTTQTKAQKAFFTYLFGQSEGHLCIAYANDKKKNFRQVFFNWPGQAEQVSDFVAKNLPNNHIWFGVALYDIASRGRANTDKCSFLWADLDEVSPVDIDPDYQPTLVLESSPGRYQAFWRLEEPIASELAQDYSRRLAYYVGADKTGWDLEQLLRVPFTYNFKYDARPLVDILYTNAETEYTADHFNNLPEVAVGGEVLDRLPEIPEIPEWLSADTIIYKYKHKLMGTGFAAVYSTEPHESDDWSRILWRLINICIEAGMDTTETLIVAQVARCNKYSRDKRPLSYLWRDVNKAYASQRSELSIFGEIKPLIVPDLVPADYEPRKGIISDYCEWATDATDAVTDFHDLSVFIGLSCLLASSLKLDARWGALYPNLWGLLLGDSTLARKTTAMNVMYDFVADIDHDILMSTDGSAEGLMTRLGDRPDRVSMFFRDEVAGFFDAISKKDYLASMPQLMTQLYDVPKFMSRSLRKETITVRSPYFVFFGGGIKADVFGLIPREFIMSGFIPRFLVVCGSTDMAKVRLTGPATNDSGVKRFSLMTNMRTIHAAFNKQAAVEILGQPTVVTQQNTVELTQDAWDAYNKIEYDLMENANNSHISDLALPTFIRLGFSILKMSMLVAAARQGEPTADHKLVVTENDINDAAYYGQKFAHHSVELIQHSGVSDSEKFLRRILNTIRKRPGITRSDLMRTHSLSSKQIKDISQTLLERGLVRSEATRGGGGIMFWPEGGYVGTNG